MKIKSMLILTSFMIALASPALAANTGVLTVSSVRAYDNDTALVVFSSNFSSTAGCSSNNAVLIENVSTSGGAMLKIALSAFLSGKNARAELSGSCSGGYEVADRVDILN